MWAGLNKEAIAKLKLINALHKAEQQITKTFEKALQAFWIEKV